MRACGPVCMYSKLNDIVQLSGGLILASLVQVFIGCTGIIGSLMRFIGPLTIIPTVSLIGLSMFGTASRACQGSWIVSMW